MRALVLAAALAAVLTGCGDLTPTSGPVAGTANAPHLTRAQFAPAVTKAMTQAGSVHLHLRGTKGGEESVFDEDYSGLDGGNIRLVMVDRAGLFGQASTRKQELRLVGNRMFVSVADEPGKFMAYAADDPHTLCGCMAHALRKAVSPSGRTAFWRRGLVGLDFVGLEAKDSMYLEHYRAQVDPVRLVGAKRAHRMKLPARLTYDVWLDSQHLIRHAKGQLLGMTYDATYSDWGARIDLAEPGPKQVVNLSRA